MGTRIARLGRSTRRASASVCCPQRFARSSVRPSILDTAGAPGSAYAPNLMGLVGGLFDQARALSASRALSKLILGKPNDSSLGALAVTSALGALAAFQSLPGSAG